MTLQHWGTVVWTAGNCVGFLVLLYRERKFQEATSDRRQVQRRATAKIVQRELLEADLRIAFLRAENDRLRAELARADVETRP